jgi:uroporphyrinogen decarboxylase
MLVDDEPLFDEIIDTVGELCYRCTEAALESGAQFDFAHFWEDISFKSGPLINPRVFRAKVGPHYRRITDLVHRYGIDIVSLDSDGRIDELIPVWFDNGVNTMFPIEVGTWDANIKPWREQYGRGLRGVGGMNKKVFAWDYAAIDAEVERLKPLVELGGYIPCPDHRIPPDAKWENVQYYCEKMREAFG